MNWIKCEGKEKAGSLKAGMGSCSGEEVNNELDTLRLMKNETKNMHLKGISVIIR